MAGPAGVAKPQTARCNSCGRQAAAQTVRSPLGKVVTVIFCGTCDVAEPK